MVKINGDQVLADGKSVAQVLCESSFDRGRIAVELNCEFLPKAEFESTVLKDGDVLEVVSFVGGG